MKNTVNSPLLYIGIMSGTSADGVDLALVDFSNNQIKLVAEHFTAYTTEQRKEITSLYLTGSDEIERSQALDISLAKFFAYAINEWLSKENIAKSSISAIGNHGQTIRHRPNNQHAFTLQIGCNQTLATLTNIRVIGDFRKKDIVYGGQGAPLVPAFHQALFGKQQQDMCIVNIGGIANISFLPSSLTTELTKNTTKGSTKRIMGFDTGPGNALMDAWCLQHTKQSFDDGGQWAASGACNEALLADLLDDDYFKQEAPKSTGREYFHLEWLNKYIKTNSLITPADVQKTLLYLTAMTIANDIKALTEVDQLMNVYLCGGGALNPELVNLLKQKLPMCSVEKTEQLKVNGNMLEAMAFAWFAYAFDHNIIGNIPRATGAKKALVLGIPFTP